MKSGEIVLSIFRELSNIDADSEIKARIMTLVHDLRSEAKKEGDKSILKVLSSMKMIL